MSLPHGSFLLFGACLLLATAGCSEQAKQTASPPSAANRPPRALAIESVSAAGLECVLRLTPGIYSGGEPHGEEAFASLARLGVKTVISVDGARPNVSAARSRGLRYVHVPIGYDGVSKAAGESLARAVRECEGPIFIHCHHGQHRGPAAAAVACVAAGAATPQEAIEVLNRAGTGKNYPGLRRDVSSYVPPAKDAALPPLVETAEVESLAASMAKLDRHFDNLKLCQQAKWSVPPDHPDLVPSQESLILREELHEATRHLGEKFDARFRGWLADSEAQARELEEAVRSGDAPRADAQLDQLEQSCKQCHAAYRNGEK